MDTMQNDFHPIEIMYSITTLHYIIL